jgi:hypothetical protein
MGEAGIVVGPLLRYTGATEATVWVETDRPCEVEVLGTRARTFHVEGHHYALVRIQGLEPGSTVEYAVALDGHRAWPEDGSGFPPSVIRTHGGDGPVRIAWGSCRVCAPHEPPWSLPKDEDPRGREVDSLRVMATDMTRTSSDDWPHALVLLGDQVYADEVSPETRAFIRSRRDVREPPGEQVADFEEYTRLYRESWMDPHIRWLLSTVPVATIFDDHDVHDDWNTSDVWVRSMRATSWWDARITGALMSYWLYQHIGNLPPEALAEDATWLAVQGAEDAGPLLREFAERADREVDGSQWSYCRDFGRTRLVVIDSRAGRVLEPGRRSMVDEQEFAWIESHVEGGHDHVLIGTSLPVLLAPGMHFLEAWNEAICDGAWGPLGRRLGEKLRQALDLEHWAAFDRSFHRLIALMRDVARGERGPAPATVIALSGDVHHAYLAEVGWPRGTGARSKVWQATCSPFRNPLDDHERRGIRLAWTRGAGWLARGAARLAGVRPPGIAWRFVHDAPWFDNQVCILTLEGREARLTLRKTEPHDHHGYVLETVFEHDLHAVQEVSRDRVAR